MQYQLLDLPSQGLYFLHSDGSGRNSTVPPETQTETNETKNDSGKCVKCGQFGRLSDKDTQKIFD